MTPMQPELTDFESAKKHAGHMIEGHRPAHREYQVAAWMLKLADELEEEKQRFAGLSEALAETNKYLENVIRAQRREERERCAKIAEETDIPDVFEYADPCCHTAFDMALSAVANAIRNAGEQATLTTEPSREGFGPASPAPAKFRKKPVVIEAIQWTGNNLREVIAFTGRHESAMGWTWEQFEEIVRRGGLKIFTLEGPLMAPVGHWIIKGVKGEVYPCEPEIFAATYEPASPAPARRWQHDETGRICEMGSSPGDGWHEIPPAPDEEERK